jgi:adenylate cyclase
MERRLAAIMATDVVGYSRLIRADEEGTLAALKALRADLIDPKIAEHHGRIVKLMGDGMLVEFASVVDAVHAAVETQQAVIDHNSDVPADKRIELRIGINLGDVVIDGDDIQGDGINVAARLEGMAEPGGICVSGMVYEGVRDRIDVPFEDLGEQEVKNIDRPMRVWRWPAVGAEESAPAARGGPLPLPDKPSIAVLPFDNLSGDPEQEYFADGIAEDVITGLSRIRWLFVIARNSTFAYKGSAQDVRRIAAELGVRYVLEGSVRKAGERVRVTAQLIDATNGNHIWAERYDRRLTDIFELQDEITSTICGTIGPELDLAEIQRARIKPPNSLDAWDKYLRASDFFMQPTAATFAVAVRHCEEAIALAPEFARAYSRLARIHQMAVTYRLVEDRKQALEVAFAAAQRAVALDDRDAEAHAMVGRVYDLQGRFEDAWPAFDRALSLNPSFAFGQMLFASCHLHAGNPVEALPAMELAVRLSPRDSFRWFMELGQAFALSQLGRHGEAIEHARASIANRREDFWTHLGLAVVCAQAGDLEAAKTATAEILQLRPEFRLSYLDEAFSTAATSYREFIMGALRKSGVAE